MTKLLSALKRTMPVVALIGFSISAQSEPIIGIGNAGGLASSSILYSINPLNGAVTALGPSGTNGLSYPVSSGPVGGSYFALSPVNHYLLSIASIGTSDPPFGQWECYSCNFPLGDFAFDSSNGKLFSLTPGFNMRPYGLLQLTNTGRYSGGCPVPNCYNLAASYVAEAPTLPALSIIEYIRGLGLYGTDGHAAYLIDETTGATTRLPSLAYTGPIITGLAHDPDSGRLIGTSGSIPGFFGGTGGPSTIYNIDPLTGVVMVLNSNAPDMYGLAAIAPEPSTLPLLGAGLLGVWWYRRLRATRMLT